ncbi:MAG: ATP synthase F0 subunit B [Desulfobacterales bacterium]|nr:MAG: ATP synthase F0 subunit B [Desulfobacterales bacterium]
MKYVRKTVWMLVWMMVLVFSLHFFGYETFAAEKTTKWRPTYDLILRWINFGIIVLIFYKYAKTPIMNFLRGQKEKLAKEIKKLEDKKEDMANKVKEMQKALDDSEVHFADLKERIIHQGDRRKQEIIESAKNHSRIMLEDANRKIDSYILSSKNTFKAELIDAAIELAKERLPNEITDEDNERFITQYLSNVSTD